MVYGRSGDLFLDDPVYDDFLGVASELGQPVFLGHFSSETERQQFSSGNAASVFGIGTTGILGAGVDEARLSVTVIGGRTKVTVR